MVNSYVLVLADLMHTCGALGDRYGRKRLLLLRLALFGAASAAAAWAGSAGLAMGVRCGHACAAFAARRCVRARIRTSQ